jgi:hypothetical protein
VIRETKRGWKETEPEYGNRRKMAMGWLAGSTVKGQSLWEADPTCSGQVRPVVGPFPPRAHLRPTVSLPRFLGTWARARFFYSFLPPSAGCCYRRATAAPQGCASARGPAPRWTHPSSCRSLNRTSRIVLGFAVIFFYGGFDFMSGPSAKTQKSCKRKDAKGILLI